MKNLISDFVIDEPEFQDFQLPLEEHNEFFVVQKQEVIEEQKQTELLPTQEQAKFETTEPELFYSA